MCKRWMLGFMFLLGCQQNPYQGLDGVQEPQPKPKTPGTAEGKKPIAEGAYSLKVDDLMKFEEGKAAEYTIRGTVPKSGKPKLVLSGMPPGMTFDPVQSKLSWLPDFQAANDPQNPLRTTREYILKVELFSTADPVQVLSKDVVILVQDQPQEARVISALEASGVENSELIHEIQFVDNEFMAGPFSATLTGFPAGTVLEWPSPSTPAFRIKWTPSREMVKNASSASFGGHVAIYNPRGVCLQFDVQWTVSDFATQPRIDGPERVSQKGDVDFMVMAEDLNAEESPQWNLESGPEVGKLEVTTILSGGASNLPRSILQVSWRDIPNSAKGKEHEVTLSACVRGDICSYYTVYVTPEKGN